MGHVHWFLYGIVDGLSKCGTSDFERFAAHAKWQYTIESAHQQGKCDSEHLVVYSDTSSGHQHGESDTGHFA